MNYVHHLASANLQLPKRVSSNDKVNVRKEGFDIKLHLSEITSNFCISIGEQVQTLGTERLLSLNEKFYKYYKWSPLDISCLVKHSHLHPERWASVVSKHFERSSP